MKYGLAMHDSSSGMVKILTRISIHPLKVRSTNSYADYSTHPPSAPSISSKPARSPLKLLTIIELRS